ncbi:MAG: NAD(P)-binding domain-containing protein [Candidatus Dojkabacteria bacterium]|nr:NAD(P)-binding domain-containing protein [Candidatus Dojkabacteria bacterium]
MDNSATFALFGATGDLAKRRSSQPLFELYKENKLSKNFKIIGISRRTFDNKEFREYLKTQVLHNYSESTEKFLEIIEFVSTDFNDPKGYEELSKLILKNSTSNTIFHLAVRGDAYSDIIGNLKNIRGEFKDTNIRIIVEKPIGTDFLSAIKINRLLESCFSEEETFLIDHYLHKGIVRNIFALRFFNSIYKFAWDNDSIEKIEIVLNEDFGVETRGAFYDSVGTLKDVGQNHILQIVALLTMDKPVDFSSAEIRSARADLLSRLKILNIEEIKYNTYRAQYKGYREIDGVNKKSNKETFFKIKFYIDMPKWRNVPIIIQSGKKLPSEEKYVKITFREVEVDKAHKDLGVENLENYIKFNLPPKENLSINFDMMSYANGDNLECKILESKERKQYLDEYKIGILDVIHGKQTWFVSFKEVLASWRFIDPIVNAWDDNVVALETYKQNSDKAIESSNYINEKFTYKTNKEIGVVGLGKMGQGIAEQLLEEGWKVIAYNRSKDKIDNFVGLGGEGAYSYKELVEKLKAPRIIWVMVPSGDAVEDVLVAKDGLINYLEPGDYLIDAGNSNYKNTIKRYER